MLSLTIHTILGGGKLGFPKSVFFWTTLRNSLKGNLGVFSGLGPAWGVTPQGLAQGEPPRQGPNPENTSAREEMSPESSSPFPSSQFLAQWRKCLEIMIYPNSRTKSVGPQAPPPSQEPRPLSPKIDPTRVPGAFLVHILPL